MSKKSVWYKEELKTLKKLGKKASMKQLQEALPNKSYYSIQDKKLKLVGGRFDRTEWSSEEDRVLRDNQFKLYKELVNLLKNKTIWQIKSRKKKLGLSYKESRLSKKDIEIIKRNYLNLNDEELARQISIDVKPGYIRAFRKKNNLKKSNNPNQHIWTAKQLEFLKKNYPSKLTLQEVATELGIKSKDTVRFKAQKLGISGNRKKNWTKKDDEILKKNYQKTIDELINEHFPNFKRHDINRRKAELNLKKRKIWTNEDIFKLKELSKKEYLIDIYDAFPEQSKQSVRAKYYDLGLRSPNLKFPKQVKDFYKSKNNEGKKLENFFFKSTSEEINLNLECKKGHIFQRSINQLFAKYYRVSKRDYIDGGQIECPICASKLVTKDNNVLKKLPNLSRYIDRSIHKDLDLSKVYYKSDNTYHFLCIKNTKHKFQNTFRLLSNSKLEICPYCRQHWDKRYLKIFLKSVVPLLPSMSPSERWVFFQQSGILDSSKRNIAFAKQVATQKFPIKEIEKFVNDEVSLVDDILDDPTITSEDYTDTKTDSDIEQEVEQTIQEFDGIVEQEEQSLPEIKSKDVLKSLDQITSSQFCDKEAIEFLIVSKKEKLWRDVFERGKVAVNEIKKANGNEYVKRAQSEFLFEYDHTAKLKSPKNFTARTNDGNLIKPNLMQFLTTTRLDYNSRIGNWSGTGAGKTLSAILASRLLDMKFTIVTCPNSVVANWQNNIIDAFQDSEILDKNELPNKINPQKHSYLVLNYEYFQQPTSSSYVKKLLSLGKISFIVIDEVHYTKQREVDNVSKRKEMIKNLVVEAGKKNKNLKVIGMSATPVINNLYEGRSMIELITGKEHKDIDTTVNVNNCMYLFQKLSTIGTRYLPQYQVGIKEEPHYVDCSDVVEEIREKGANRISVLDLELILTRKRIPEIIKHLEKKTVIYTHYIKGIGELLAEAISKEGYTVGFYTGEDKSGFDSFIKGNTDVLIGTSAIGTGVDGLQHVCRKLIFNVLPWTNAEYEQIKGRIFRQGQKQDVEFILPLTKAEVNGQEWSWCKTKLDRIHYKKTVADASVDGIIPEEHIRSEHQVLQDLMKWLDRLSDKGLETIERKELASTLFTDDDKELRRRKINHGDFTKINTRWNGSRSVVTHKRLQKNKSEWVHYHEEYRKARKDWVMTPYKEMVKFYKKRDGLVIGDFGCGEGFIYKELSSKHTVHSFDHVAMEEFVTECDFSKTPLDDETLDVAIYSLSMMGSNINEYLHEAHRVLKLDGKINIIEATSRFKDVKQFMNQLQDFGFDRVVSSDMWKFTHIVAEKSDRVTRKDAKIKF